jgi:alpha-amylase/alpha-mannosidase (GH57 family)
MIYWAPFLHLYQPPTQFHAVLKKICRESYRPLLDVFEANPKAKVTVNICGVLTESLMDHGASDVVERMKKLAERGQLEFVGTSKYHAILPLIPPQEALRQIELNQKTNAYFFKKSFSPKGFFPPEMCYSKDILGPINKTGHKWILISGVACQDEWPMDKIYQIKSGNSSISVFFRDDILSNKISFHSIDGKGFLEHLKGVFSAKKDAYVITAMDGETFGHHIQNWEKLFLAKVYDVLTSEENIGKDIKQRVDLAKSFKDFLSGDMAGKIKVVTISELLDIFPKGKFIEPRPSSWSSSIEDIEYHNYYPLWLGNDNEVHGLQWELVKICIEMVYKAQEVATNSDAKNFANISRMLLDRALHSCQFWWASRRPMWDINLVNKGILMQDEVLLNAYKAIKFSPCNEDIKREYYHKIVASRDLINKIRDWLFVF